MNEQLTSASIWSVLDNLSEGVIMAEANGIIAYINQSALSGCGFADRSDDVLQMDDLFMSDQDWPVLMIPPTQTELQVKNGRFYQFQVPTPPKLHSNYLYTGCYRFQPNGRYRAAYHAYKHQQRTQFRRKITAYRRRFAKYRLAACFTLVER